MRILVVGAGAIGGYFGGRLLEAGRDVTFLVGSRRAAQLAKTGYVIRSKFGDASLPTPPPVMAAALREPYDLILLGCKAYDLAAAADSFAPAVGPDTAILPFLNGMAHLDFLATRFGARAVLGGQCLISATLDAEGRVLHLNESHLLSFGEQDGSQSPRAKAIAATLAEARFVWGAGPDILQEMWEKGAFIAAAAGICSLMRAPFGDITAAGAAHYTTGMYDECRAIAAANGFVVSDAPSKRTVAMFTAPGSVIAASMLRDIEHGALIEGDHIVGDLLRRGEKESADFPLLRIAYAHLRTYEARRKREAAKA